MSNAKIFYPKVTKIDRNGLNTWIRLLDKTTGKIYDMGVNYYFEEGTTTVGKLHKFNSLVEENINGHIFCPSYLSFSEDQITPVSVWNEKPEIV